MVRIARCLIETQQASALTFPTETGSAALFPIPSSSAEWVRSPRELYFAVSSDPKNSFARSEFVFSPVWKFRKQSDSVPERSRHGLRALSAAAKRIGRSILPPHAPPLIAFVQA
jgi:hypothetical protein